MRTQIVCKIVSASCLYTVIGLKREETVGFDDKTVGRRIVLAFLPRDSHRYAVNLIALDIEIVEGVSSGISRIEISFTADFGGYIHHKRIGGSCIGLAAALGFRFPLQVFRDIEDGPFLIFILLQIRGGKGYGTECRSVGKRNRIHRLVIAVAGQGLYPANIRDLPYVDVVQFHLRLQHLYLYFEFGIHARNRHCDRNTRHHLHLFARSGHRYRHLVYRP